MSLSLKSLLYPVRSLSTLIYTATFSTFLTFTHCSVPNYPERPDAQSDAIPADGSSLLLDLSDYEEAPTLKIAFIVDQNSYTIADSQLEEVLDQVHDQLLEKTSIETVLHGIHRIRLPKSESQQESFNNKIIDNYFNEHRRDSPHYVVIFHSDQFSREVGAYTVWSSYLTDEGFCNNFVSPTIMFSSSYVYGAVVDWDKRFAACGYDLEHYRDTGEYLGRSDYSLNDGSCQNQFQIPCRFNSELGYRVCSNFDSSLPYFEEEKSYLIANIIHELMHYFGTQGEMDHFGTKVCDMMMGGSKYREDDPINSAQDNFSICPFIFDAFRDSYSSLCR